MASISDTPTWSHALGTFNYTVGSGSNRLLVAEILWYGATDRNVSTCTYNGTTLTKAVGSHYVNAGYYLTVEIWYLIAPASGTNSLVISLSGAVDGSFCSVQSGDGFKQSAQPDATNSAQYASTSTPDSTAITVVADQSFIFDCIINGGWTGPITATSPQVDGSSTFASYKGAVSAGSNSMEWNWVSGTQRAAHVLASFAPVVSTNTSNFFQVL